MYSSVSRLPLPCSVHPSPLPRYESRSDRALRRAHVLNRRAQRASAQAAGLCLPSSRSVLQAPFARSFGHRSAGVLHRPGAYRACHGIRLIPAALAPPRPHRKLSTGSDGGAIGSATAAADGWLPRAVLAVSRVESGGGDCRELFSVNASWQRASGAAVAAWWSRCGQANLCCDCPLLPPHPPPLCPRRQAAAAAVAAAAEEGICAPSSHAAPPVGCN